MNALPTGKPILHFEIFLEKLELREAVERVPLLVLPIAVLVYPQFGILLGLLWNVSVYESDFLCSKVMGDVARDQRKWTGWAITSKGDINGVLCA